VVFTQAGNDSVQFAKDVIDPAFVYSGPGNKIIVGGGGPDVFVGGPGNDLLVGGSSRNILIGGRGSDMLLGNGADDILIAGYTSLDNNDAALAAVFNEWNRATVPAATRISDLTNGGGFNGSVVLNSSTVFNDNAADILIGGGGSDWFLSSSNDLILGRSAGSVRTRI
jgi:Ca2+-binding RTX toxin-like protein